MLEKPEVEDTAIRECLESEYGLAAAEITFLPLGADQNTAVYRARAGDGSDYFCKLRAGDFNEATVRVPKYLSERGIRQIIAPVAGRGGRLWTQLERYTVIVYPFVVGKNAFEQGLTEQQWLEFGAAMRTFHSADIPAALTGRVRRETFSACWRDKVRYYLGKIQTEQYKEAVAAEMAAFLLANLGATLDLVERAERLAVALRGQEEEFILCHGDIHGWNLLVVDGRTFYMVDWDTLIFAPKERDLMFIGSGLAGKGFKPEEEEALFYHGYGAEQVDPVGLSYYRCERIVEDIAVFCEQIFLSDQGGEDRVQALDYLKSNYLPGGTIEMAYRKSWLSGEA